MASPWQRACCGVAHGDDVDARAVVRLDARCVTLERRGEGAVGIARRRIQPRAELALLGARQPGDLGRVAREALDEGEGLQH